jgi:hypothetical protein
MKTPFKPSVLFCLVITTALIAIGSACQPATNTNTNANLTVNTNTAPVNVNANVSTAPTTGIATREPERYRATLSLSAETEGGQKTIGIPTLSAEIARNGTDRRISFKLPDGSDFIYLEKGGLHLVIAPGRKQYAELTPEATGFQLHRLMTPGQLASRLENLKGVERIGEETITGRTAEKYRYTTTRNTGTQAGQVSAEAFVFVDKETGLPLRAELFTEASGDVQGMKGAKVVAEMKDITTTIDNSLFEVPVGFSKVPPEQVKQQIDALMNAAAAVVKALLSSTTTQSSPTTTVSPAATSSPSPRD